MNSEKDKKEKFLPGTEREEEFDRVLSVLSEWVESKQVDIDVDLDGDIDISLPREPERLLSSTPIKDLPVENVVGIVEYEVPALLTAGLCDDVNVKEWLAKSLPEKLLENIDAMSGRSKKAMRALGSEELKQRLLLRKGTSGYAIQDILCKQKTYHHRGKDDKKVSIPHVTLEITFAKPRSRMMFGIDPLHRTAVTRRSEEVTVELDLHKRDFEKLIERLQKTLETTNE